MADEVTDCSNKEQFITCFRWVDKGFDTHEDFIGTLKQTLLLQF